jgi:hypothetical protein
MMMITNTTDATTKGARDASRAPTGRFFFCLLLLLLLLTTYRYMTTTTTNTTNTTTRRLEMIRILSPNVSFWFLLLLLLLNKLIK